MFDQLTQLDKETTRSGRPMSCTMKRRPLSCGGRQHHGKLYFQPTAILSVKKQ